MLLDKKIVIAETLLSHYKTVKNIQEGQMKEFLDYIYKTLPSIYAAFVSKGCISKGDTQNIVSNYITLIKKTIKSIVAGKIYTKNFSLWLFQFFESPRWTYCDRNI